MQGITQDATTHVPKRPPRLHRTKLALAGQMRLVLIAVLTCIPAAAHAQVNLLRSYRGPVLSRADLDAGKEAAGRLLGNGSKPVGAVETWTNPASGNSGTLTIERAYQRQGRACRAVRSRVTYHTGTERSLLHQVCRVSGRWRLAD